MRCLSAVILFGLIAINLAGAQQGADSKEARNANLLHRLRRETHTVSQMSSSSSFQQGDGPIQFQQSSSSFQGGSPNGPIQPFQPIQPIGLFDRFGEETLNPVNAFQAAQIQQAQIQQAHNDFINNALGVPQGLGTQTYSGTQGTGTGHVSVVSGTYDPHSQQTTIHQNYNQKV